MFMMLLWSFKSRYCKGHLFSASELTYNIWNSRKKNGRRRRTDKTKMATRLYSYWVFVAQDREINNASTQDLSNQLQTVLGTHRLLSLTSSATNGVIVTTMAYEVPDE